MKYFSDSKYHVTGLQTLLVTWTGAIIDEVCTNFPCQNMTVTPKLAAAFALLVLSHSCFQRQRRRFKPVFKRKQTRFVLERKWL